MSSESGSTPEPTTQSTQQQAPASTNWLAIITMMLGSAALSGALIDVSGVPANLEFTGTMMVVTTLLT